ncbi:MAG: accessory gene regulator B family protein [Lachnospiraceae bacterium]|jgi:accessory gene regulator B|nr:accessory gene regulator B family protein [Lachnospiraceae bacterium]
MIIENVSNRLCDHFVDNQIIEEEDRELYYYGVHQGIVMIINFVSMAIIGLVLNMFWESIVFMICFIPIRIYAGGYHAKTQLRCYFISQGINALALVAIRYLPVAWWLTLAIVVVTTVLFLILAPSEAENKPLEPYEVVKYKKIALRHWIIEVVVLTALYLTDFFLADVYIAGRLVDFRAWGNCILIGFILLSILLVMGEVSRVRREKRKALNPDPTL